MTLMITGATGFVGGHLQQLLDCVPFAKSGEKIDLRDARQVQEVVGDIRPHAVIHLAAHSYVPTSFEEPENVFDINFYGTLNLLRALKSSGFDGRFLYVSSGDIYGNVAEEKLPVTEEYTPRPRNPYAVSKVAAEALCYQWSQTEALHIVVARPFNHIGTGQSERFVLSGFGKQIAEISMGRSPAVVHVGDIDVTRDFTDVKDIVAAYSLLLEHGENGEVYNVCTGIERSLRALLDKMLEIAAVECSIQQDERRLRGSEQRRMVGSFDKLRRATGWCPAVPIEESLMDILTGWKRVLE